MQRKIRRSSLRNQPRKKGRQSEKRGTS